MPETLLEHANNPPAVPLYEGSPPNFSILADDDPTLIEPALIEPPVVPPAVERDDEGRLTDDAVEAARRMVERANLVGERRANPPMERMDGEAEWPSVGGTERQSTLLGRHPDWPQDITFDYWLDIHGTAEDFNAAPKKIAAADILIIEAGGQDAGIKASILQDIANVDPSRQPSTFLDDYMRTNGYLGTKNEQVMRALYGTRKAVGSFDLKGADLQHNLDLIAAARRAIPDFKLGDYDATIDDFTAKLQDVGQRQRQREHMMAKNVEPEMQRILDSRPDLKNRPSLQVVEPMGKIHGTLREDLAGGDLGIHVEGDIPDDADFNHRDQIIRRTMRGETDIPRDLKIRALSEYVVAVQLITRLDEAGRQELASTSDFNDYVRDTVARMSEADMRFIYRNESVDPLTPPRMDRLLVSMGLPAMPHNIAGLRDAAAQVQATEPRR